MPTQRDRERNLLYQDRYTEIEAVSLATDASGVPSFTDASGAVLQVRGIYVGVAGHLTLDMGGKTVGVLLSNVPVGFHRLVGVTRIMKTGTTATNLNFCY